MPLCAQGENLLSVNVILVYFTSSGIDYWCAFCTYTRERKKNLEMEIGFTGFHVNTVACSKKKLFSYLTIRMYNWIKIVERLLTHGIEVALMFPQIFMP